MRGPRALIVAGALLGLGASARASTLELPELLAAPDTVTQGQFFTLTLQVRNNGPVVENVRPSLGSISNGFVPVHFSGPIPASHAALAQGETAHFTWTYSGAGCGSAQFGVAVAADQAGTPVPTAAVPVDDGPVVTLNCTPTVTPTPWLVYGTPTAVPREGWAGIPGNLYRPLLGQPLRLQAVLPETARLSVDLYDRLGNRVKRFETDAGPGSVSLAWDGRSDDGVYVATGIYVAHFKARGFSRTVKFAVLK